MLQQEKAEIRSQILAQIKLAKPDEVRKSSLKVCQFLKEDLGYQKSRVIGLFCSLPQEIDTGPIHDFCLAEGKLPAYPRLVQEKDEVLKFYIVKDRSGFVKSNCGFYQPEPGPGFTETKQIDLFLVPGLGFSRQGARLGRGKGYYDRTLTQEFFRDVPRYGLVAFEAQIFQTLPMDPWDLFVHKVITPKEVFIPSLPGDSIAEGRLERGHSPIERNSK